MSLIATTNTLIYHYGSTVVGPVLSIAQNNSPSFVSIEGNSMLSEEDLVDTPSHKFISVPPTFHSHSNQIIDSRAFSFVTIEGKEVIVEGDKNLLNDTRVDDVQQSFVHIITGEPPSPVIGWPTAFGTWGGL